MYRKYPHIPRSVASPRRQQNDKSPKLVSVNVCRRPRRRNAPQMSLWQSSISLVCMSRRRPWRPLSLSAIWFSAERAIRVRRPPGFFWFGDGLSHVNFGRRGNQIRIHYPATIFGGIEFWGQNKFWGLCLHILPWRRAWRKWMVVRSKEENGFGLKWESRRNG